MLLLRLHPFSTAVSYPFDRFNMRLQSPLLKESPDIINVPERNRNADPIKLLSARVPRSIILKFIYFILYLL